MSALTDRVFGTGEGVRAHCEFDDWDFAPRYTDGACPLCGWEPDGIVVEPATQRLKRLPAIPLKATKMMERASGGPLESRRASSMRAAVPEALSSAP